jgi:hypothetical protein
MMQKEIKIPSCKKQPSDRGKSVRNSSSSAFGFLYIDFYFHSMHPQNSAVKNGEKISTRCAKFVES